MRIETGFLYCLPWRYSTWQMLLPLNTGKYEIVKKETNIRAAKLRTCEDSHTGVRTVLCNQQQTLLVW